MFDAPPLTEIVSAILATSAVVALWRCVALPRSAVLLWAAASSVVLVALGHAPPIAVVGVAALVAVAPGLADVQQRVLGVGGLGIVVLALTNGISLELQLGAIASAIVMGLLLWSFQRAHGPSLAVALCAASAIGIYINVPDTEHIAVHASGLIVLTAALMFTRGRDLATVELYALVLLATLVMCAGAVGARGRPSAFIAVIGTLGVLLAEPVACCIRRGTRAHRVALIGVHIVVVVFVSRVAGTRTATSATWIVAAAVVAAIALLSVLPRSGQLAS